MKTLSLRLRGMKGELEELGEESEGVENISKMQGQILNMTKGKVNIFDDAGNFKSTYDIMKGIAEVYDDLSSTDQADLLETIAGKNRANDVAALISNFDTAIKMVDTAENSFGSAAGENEKYLDSLQGRLDVLQASFQAMSNSAIDDGFLKNGVSLVTRLVDAFTKLIDTIGIVPTLFTLIGGGLKLFGKNAISIDKASKSISVFGKELRAISNIAFNKNGSLFDNLFSSDFDKLPQQIEQNEKLLKQYYDTKNKTYDNDDVKNQKLNSILNEMSPAYKEAAAAESTFEAAQQAGAAAAQAEAMALNTKSTSLRAQISLLREYNSAAKTGGVSKNLGKTAQQIQEEIQGTNIGGTIVGGLVSSATDAATGKAVQVSTGKAIGSIIKGAASTAIKGAAGFVGSMFMGAIGGILISGLTDLLMNGIGWFFDNVINRAETLSKSVDEMNQKFGETKTTLSSARKTISDVGDSYAKLSAGVNTKTNENLNLSTEDYEEYLNITNQIAGQFPELVSGYDAQGNAILTCAGNVEALNEAYNTQAIEAYNETLKESSTVMEDFNNKKKEIENGTGDLAIDEKQYEHLKDALGNDSGKSIDEALKGLSDYATIAKALEDAGAEKKDGGFFGIGGESNLDFIKRVIRESPDIANEVVSQFEDSMATASEGMKSIAEAYIGKAFAEGDYSGISDGMQSVLSSVISEFDYDFYSQFDSIDAMEQQLDDMLSSFNSLNDGDKNKLELAFNLETQLNNGEISVDEYLANIKDIGSIIDGMNIDENAKQALRLSFDIDENDIEQKYNDLIDKLTQSGINESEAISWVGSLNGTDLNMAMSLDFTGKDSIEDIQEALDLTKALQGVGTIDIQVETEGFEKLNTAISESNGAVGLTQDSIDAISNRYANLEGFDPAAIFEKTTTGVRLNTRALNEMETQLISVNKAANAKNLSVLAKQAKELEESIDAANRAGEDTSGFEAQLETVRESIRDAQMAAAAYDGLTSAYKGWIDAQSAGQEGDIYTSIQEGIEGMQELANEGRWGNTQLQEFIKMFSTEGSMDTATPQQFADSWGSAITKANRYFTEGTQGLDNFFKDVAARTDELVYMDESGSWQIKPGVEIEDFAREMEIANSTVEAIFGNANEYGANFEIGIEQQSLDELISESEKVAQEASDALKSALGEDFEISYDLKVNEDGTNNAQEELDKLKAKRDEINNSDATVEVKQQGLDAVNAQIESLIREKIQLEQPTFMTLDASQVNASLVDALGKVQEMQTAMNELTTLNQMQEAGIQIDTSDVDAAQQRVDECAQAIQGLDGDVKIAIGLEEDGSIDSIKSSFADGKVNIPIGAESEGIKSATEEVQKRLETIKDKNVTLTINVDGDVDAFEKASEGAKNLDGVKSNAVIMTAKLDSNLDGKDAQIDNLNEFVDAAKNLDGVSSSTVHLNAYLDSDIWGNDKKGQLENLPKFAEAAKELQGLDESTTVRLNAYFDSNVWGNDKSAQLENLDTFCDAVKQLQGIDESTTVRLNAYLDSNLWGDDKSAQLKNIDTFVDAATKLKDMGGEITTNIKAYFDSNVWGDDKTSQLSNMEDFTKAAQELQGIGDATVHLSTYLDSNLWGDDKSAQLDNINAFSEAAQMLNGIGDVTVHLNAYLDSNVWGTDKSVQLSNIDSFADAAQKLQGIGDTTVHLNAYLDSNVWGSDKAAQLGNLDAFADIANRLNGISDVNVSVNANISNAPEQSETDKLMTFSSVVNQLQGVSNVNVSVGANVDIAAIDNVRTSLQGLSNSGVMHDYTANITVNANTSAIDAIKSSIASIQTRVVAVTATANGTQAVNALKASIDAVTAKTVDVTANVTGTDDVNALTAAINGVSGKSVSVSATTSGLNSVYALSNAIANVRSKTVTITARQQTVGVNSVNGTAHVDGTVNSGGKAFKQGTWGTKKSGIALMGELGPEIIVRGDKWFTVGDNGAGFYQYKKGDIIFNHIQAKELLENGYVSSSGGRGRAFVEGTAFASVSGGWKPGGVKPSGSSGNTVVNNTTNNYNYNTSSKSSSSSSKSSSSAKKAADEFKESLDWIEIAIDRIERALDNLDTVASSTYRSWSERNSALNESMAVTRQEIELQQQAYDRYMQEASSVGLSADWINKIQNGLIDLETIGDEALNDQIEEYKKYYEAALDARDSVIDLTEALGDLAQQKFENVEKQFAGALNALEFVQNDIQTYIDREELNGHFISEKYYTELMNNVHQQAEQLRAQRDEMIKARDEAVNAGTITVGSEEWDEQNAAINEVSLSIHELGNQWREYYNSMREAKWDVFDLLQDRISGVADEAQFLIDLMSNEKLFEDNGQLTDKGWATMGLYGQQYNVFMNQADRYAEEIKRLEEEMAQDPYDMDLADRYYELIDAQQEAILSAEDMKNSIKDMVEEGIELELDALDDLIDKYLDALQAQKDLYDYENEIRDKTDDIAMLEKQLSAYAGDDSEESKATIQELTEQLTEAQRDLQDAEYERQISDVERLLDQMRLDYETILNMRLDNIDMLIEQMIAEINANAGSISETISAEAQGVGYQLSDEMQSIWNGANNVLAYYGDNFINNGTTVANTLSSINTGIQNMIAKLDAIARQSIAASQKTEASKTPVSKPSAPSAPSTPTPTPSPSPAPSSGGDGVPRVGDRVKFVSGSYYLDSYGTAPLGYHNRGGYVYITAINSRGSKPYHISTGSRLGSGDLGWLTLAQLAGYAKGKRLIDNDELAWTQENGTEMIVRPSDGAILTPLAKNDSVLNAVATQNIWDMANDPSAFVRDNLGIGGSSVSPAATAGNTNYNQDIQNVTFSFPNVKNYEELLASMQKDRNFERLINSMTLDKIAGKNSLSKSKAIR